MSSSSRTQADYPLTLGSLGQAWLDAAQFERERLHAVRSPTAQDGLTPAIRKLAVDRCEKLIALYESRATTTLKEALNTEAVNVAADYEFSKIEGAA